MPGKHGFPFRAAALLALPFLAAAAAAAAGEYAGYADLVPGGWRVMFSELLQSVDVVCVVLLTLLLALVGMSWDLLGHLRVGRLVPEDLLAEVQAEMAGGEYEKALDLCGKSDSLIGQIFAAALAKTDYSFERMSAALESEARIQALVWRQWVRHFRIFAVLGPMFGCIGAILNGFRMISDLAGRPNIGLALAASVEMRMVVYNVFSALLIGFAMGALSLGVYAFASSKLEKILAEARRLGEELLDPFRPLPLPPEE